MSQSAADSDQDPTTAAESYGDYSVDDEDQPVGEDNLVTGDGSDVADEMERGYNPPERWSAAEGFGNTPYEEAVGETLEQRLAQEEPDPAAKSIEEIVEEAEAEDLADREVGDDRAGRLVAPDEGAHTDVEKDLVATDVGIDGAAASAEEAAVHVVDEEVVLDDVVGEATVFDLVVDEDLLDPEVVGDPAPSAPDDDTL